MIISPVDQELAPAGVRPPRLAALVPDVHNYQVLLAQPEGMIAADAAGVRNRNPDRATTVFRRFLEKAVETNADLAVTPEYSLPWQTLIAALRDGCQPAAGKLWALGCESITVTELTTRQAELADVATVLFEPMEMQANRFLDPLVYIFRTDPIADGPARLVLLVQFKTHPMGDPYEVDHLQCGTKVYQFGNVADSIRLVSLICSDALAFTDADAAAIYQRALVLHIQLNEHPRHAQYRRYREKLFDYHGDETEILCLNWASGVREWSNGAERTWDNASGSGWYLRPKEFDRRDATLCANHARGLYYTWLKSSRSHVLFLNYAPGTYLIETTKVGHIAVPASVSRRSGPKVVQGFRWDPTTAALVAEASAADGFAAIIDQSGAAQNAVQDAYNVSPLAAERALALCAGKIGPGAWYEVGALDSFEIATTEIVRRITFCQDTEQEAAEFRSLRLIRCRHLWQFLSDPTNLPNALKDLTAGFGLAWQAGQPHQNIRSIAGAGATAIYLGEDVGDAVVDAIAKIAADNLWRTAANENNANTNRQRLAVWHRRDGQLQLVDPRRYARFDDPRNNSEFDIVRQT